MKYTAPNGKRFLRGDLHLFETLFVITWENNSDFDITMPLSLKTMEVQIKGTNEIRGFERCRSTVFRTFKIWFEKLLTSIYICYVSEGVEEKNGTLYENEARWVKWIVFA